MSLTTWPEHAFDGLNKINQQSHSWPFFSVFCCSGLFLQSIILFTVFLFRSIMSQYNKDDDLLAFNTQCSYYDYENRQNSQLTQDDASF